MLFLFVLLMAGASTANAGLFCSDAPFGGPDEDGDGKADYGIVDGSVDYSLIIPGFVFPTQITIDTDCTFQNFPASNPLTATLNFQTNDPSVYLIIFNNVIFTGNMACANIDHRIWFVNGSDYGSNNNCQDLFIPVEAIQKRNPAGQTTVGIGDPYTYTLTIPVLFDPVTQTYINNAGSANDLHSITVIDDLNATGANLTLVGTPTVVWDDGLGTPLAHTFNNTAGLLTFVIDPGVIIPAGDQILIDITVVADNTNAVGTQVVNTASWTFGRLIEIDGVPTFFDPLPGENGVTQPLTISAPDLVVTKSSPDTALNAASTATFTIDVQNNGGSDAWGATILDLLPDVGAPGTDIGMCDFDPTPTVTAQIVASDGATVVSALTSPADYDIDYNDASDLTDPCQISFTMKTDAAVIRSGEHLIITYQSQLDPPPGTDVTDDGTVLTNYVGATQWFSADPGGVSPVATFDRVITDGTPGVDDWQDSFDITATLSGYVFLKTVINTSSGESPATTAVPGDTLRYRLQLFNFTETIDNLVVTDQFDAAEFDLDSFNMLTPLPDGVVSFTYNNTGPTATLTVQGDGGTLNLDPNTYPELLVEFEITVASSGLNNGDAITNQATANATGTVTDANSDNPFVNGVFDPDTDPAGTEDSTDVVIQTPGALLKENPAQTEYTIGERITYRITIPENTVNTPLYDVQITDDLFASGAELSYVSATVFSGGTWSLSNIGTATSPIIADTGTGIDIPANAQAVVDITVEVLNTAPNQAGVSFDNVASYTYNRSNNDSATVTNGSGDNSGPMTIIEPEISAITKIAGNTTPTAGEIVTYSIQMTAANGANFSDVFDVAITDNLESGLVYVLDSTIVNGVATTNDPDIVGDGVNTAQTLFWGTGSTEPFDIDIPEGNNVTVQYQVQVLDTVLAGSTLNNTVVAEWTSLDGAPNFERTGVDGIGGLNDYITAPVIETLAIPNINATIDKVHTSDTYGAADTDVRIGDIVDYTLTIAMPEGTLVNAQIVDTLPQGLEFVDIVSINNVLNPGPYTAVAPFSHVDITVAGNVVLAGTPETGPSTVSWNLGNLTNLPGDDASNDFVIVYRTRVVNDALDPLNTSIPLNNTVDLNYDTAAGTTTNFDDVTSITALQPALTVTKAAAPALLDIFIDPGEQIDYTVTLENTGTAPAYDVLIQDTLPAGLRQGGATITAMTLVDGGTTALPILVAPYFNYNSATGLITWDFDNNAPDTYTIPPGARLIIEYQVQADPVLAPGLVLINNAEITDYYSFDDEAVPADGAVVDRQHYPPAPIVASTTLRTSPGVPAKLSSTASATIGQEFTYTITVPEAAQPTPLYDVRILDNLTALGVDVTLVSINNVSVGSLAGGALVPVNTSGTNNLVIEDLSNSGIDIPANEQATIEITVRLDNTNNNNAADVFSNTASYTYNADNVIASQFAGGVSNNVDITVVEPALTLAKVVTNATAGKAPADPITGGDILQYVVTITNGGAATAYDVNVVDTLPPELTYYAAFVPTATIDTAPVGGFVSTPAGIPGGPLIWGAGNGDGRLDVPANGQLIITYQAQVQISTAISFQNAVLADWTSLQGLDGNERTDAGCNTATIPTTVTQPDDYCVGPVNVISNIVDNNNISKAITNDSWATDGSTAVDAIVRVGDIATYQLTLNLGEGTTGAVTVTDNLPAGLVYENLVSITPTSGAGDFTYTVGAQPAPGATGALVWDLGDVVNAPGNDNTPLDALVIEYRARVIENDASTVAQFDSQLLQNSATLAYTNSAGNSNPAQLTATADLTVRQPIMTAISKVGALTGDTLLANTNVSPLNVNVAGTVDFQLRSCNTVAPAAPAYNIDITDTLPTQLDETSITNLVVNINGVDGAAGVGYNYTPPAIRGGSMQFEILTAVQPGQCVIIDYTMGFYNDFGPGELWNNSAALDVYWSLPASTGQQYPGSGPAEFFMTNQVNVEPLTKAVITPDPNITDEVTIGDLVEYSIVVPGNPLNAQLTNVVVTDALVNELVYIGATAVDNAAQPVVLVGGSTGQNVELTIAQIPAGEQVTITLQARVANNVDANAGDTFINTADYDYTGKPVADLTGGSSGSLRIVEPEVAIAKIVIPNTPPSAGDVLTYELTFTATGGIVGDIYSDAFDLRIDDSLSLGLAYVPGTTTVDGTGNPDPVISGDGINVAQTLRWSLEDATADIDIIEGAANAVTVTYQVVVLDNVLPGQELTNSASSQWTGIDQVIGDPVSADERNGSDAPGPGVNDYFNAPVAAPALTVPDNTSLSKTRSSDTFDVTDDVRVGDVITYTLAISLDEGSHSQLVVTDQLPPGMQFEGVVSINGVGTAPYAAAAPFSHADIPTPNISGDALTGTTITWNLGGITNESVDNAANDFLIVYQARPINNDYFELNPTAILQNDASLDYQRLVAGALQAAPTILVSETVNLRQPDLVVAKTSVPPGGSVVDAGQPIDFTVQVTNNGDAPAYDTVIEDVLSVGFRQTTPVTTSIYLVSSPGSPLPVLAPVYDANTGIAVWNLDNNVENTYTIPAGDALVIEYTAQTDNDLGPGATLNNSVTVDRYYSLDDEEADTDANNREEYIPVDPPVIVTFTTPLPAALSKVAIDPVALDPLNPVTEVTIGDTFVYRITVPAEPQTTALNDVRILDDLNDVLTTDGVDLSFVSVSKISGTQTWTPANTSGDTKNLVIEDTVNGIDIPAGEQAIIDITVVVNDVAANVAGDVFANTADYTYTYNVTQNSGQPGTSGTITIIEADTMVMDKTVPGQAEPVVMRVGLPVTFELSVQNTGDAPAWDMTITDQLPNPSPGGMCDTAPGNIVAQIYQSDNVTPVDATPLVAGADYITRFTGAPADPVCTLTITMQSADAVINPGQYLKVTYEAELDLDNVNGTTLTNVAAATQWFSGDTAGAGATGETRSYAGILTNGTVGTPDEQDALDVVIEIPTLTFVKNVSNLSTPALGTNAEPGDTLRYTVTVTNTSATATLPNFSIVDELDALNAPAVFVPGSLGNITVSIGGNDNSNPVGGTNGTGLVDIRNLSLGVAGGGNDSVTITFDVTLASVIDSATEVLNQAILDTFGVTLAVSDDPNDATLDDPTATIIISAPAFQIEKVSDDITGDPAVLEQGDTLRYTITVKNTGNENTINTLLTDQIPANTTYVDGSVRLNGLDADLNPSDGVSPLTDGMPINSALDTTAGFMPADIDPAANNVATITFEVTINASAIDGTVISNQGFVSGGGAGSGDFPQQPSDDPDTTLVDDPTIDVVGTVATIDVIKTVEIVNDLGTPNIVDVGDTLRYTITLTNIGPADATGVVLTDPLPADTTYYTGPTGTGSTTLNGLAVSDIGSSSPLFTGFDISSSDLTPPLPAAGAGTLTAGQSATVTFDVVVAATAVPGTTVISNQASVSSDETVPELSDADGIDANGDQPTVIAVGNLQLVSITKQVLVVGGGAAEAGGELEYVVRVTNIGGIAASNVVITDDLDLSSMSYDSGLLNGLPAGVDFASPGVTADYAATYGDLAIGAVAELRFRVTLSAALNIGDIVSNTASVSWDSGLSPLIANVDIAIGGAPGSANLNGQVWHDRNFDNVVDSSETLLQGWTVELYRNAVLLANTQSDVSGLYQFSGLAANDPANPYEIRFVAPGAVSTTATLGQASSIFTNGPQRIRDIVAVAGDSLQSLNLPRQPNGIVYDSIYRTPVAGAQLIMVNQTQSNQRVPDICFDDRVQQGQVTLANGYYKFDLNFSDFGCAVGDEYVIQIQPPAEGYVGTTSAIIPPVVPVTGVALDVPNCPTNTADQVPTTTQHCEISASEIQPDPSLAPGDAGTEYYLKFLFDAADFTDQVFNNHIPLDPELEEAVAISKVAGLLNVTRSQLVPYTITINNTLPVPLYDLNVVDNFPAGFKYVAGSSRLDGAEVEPVVNGRQLTWQNLSVGVSGKLVIKLLLIIGSGVGEGEYVNTARVINSRTTEAFSGVASATVRVIPDPTFDCTDIIGKVFDDKNLNGYQDQGETGLPGVQVATARGLRVTTDSHGRFHITCAIVANEVRGSNFIMKLDDRTLPSGYRVTTENPRVQRATRGKMMKFNFGTAIHRIVRLDLANGVFEKDSTELRPQWRSRIDMLIIELQKDPSILRLSYLGENETESEVDDRLDVIEDLISDRWKQLNCCYKLTIEKEVFWRKGNPSDRMTFD